MNIPFLKPKTYFLKKESELLIGLLSDKISEERLMTIGRTLQEPLDWNYFMNTALTHRVTPIVYLIILKFKDLEPTQSWGFVFDISSYCFYLDIINNIWFTNITNYLSGRYQLLSISIFLFLLKFIAI